MAWTFEMLTQSLQNTHTQLNRKWVPARPLVGSWIDRLRDAWEVFRGRADAFKWPEGQ